MFAGFQIFAGVLILIIFARDLLSVSLPYLFSEILELCGVGILIGIAALIVSYAVSFYKEYVAQLEYKIANISQLSTRPAVMAAVMQVGLITGAVIIDAIESIMAGLSILILLKIISEVLSSIKKYRAYSLKDYFAVASQ